MLAEQEHVFTAELLLLTIANFVVRLFAKHIFIKQQEAAQLA